MKTYQLFFGRSCPDGSTVSDRDWASFAEAITSLFGGYTIQEGRGVWKGQSEQVMIVTICTDKSDVIHGLALYYKTRHNQDSVGLITLPPMEFL